MRWDCTVCRFVVTGDVDKDGRDGEIDGNGALGEVASLVLVRLGVIMKEALP